MARIIKKSKFIGMPPETLLYEGKPTNREVKITIFDYDQGHYEEKSAKDVNECSEFRDKPTITWINVDGIHRLDVLEKLSSCYSIHHLVLEDILNIDQRPKFEDFGLYIYLSFKMLSFDETKDEIIEEQVSMIVGKNFLFTFQEEKEGDVFGLTRERIRNNKGKIRKMGADYLAYSLLDAAVDSYFLILEKMGDRIEMLEEELVASPTAKTMQSIGKIKRSLIYLRKSVWPLREVVNSLSRQGSALISQDCLIYFNDVYDHTIHAMDTIEALRDVATGMLDIYLSSISNRLNEVMKVLTIISTIFIPLTFIAGIYGMNFNTNVSGFNMPELNWPLGYLFVLGIMLLVSLSMVAYFKRRRWF